MYSVMIGEDEIHILKHMQNIISSFEEFEVKNAFAVPEDALAVFEKIMPDVIFLDIEMPRINGIELARKFLCYKENLRIVFTTAYSQYALDAFGVEAIDYLIKPVMKSDIERVIKRLDKSSAVSKQNNISFEMPVKCFGRFEVSDHSQNIVKWPTKKAEELFAYFVTKQGQHISKWEILNLFWDDADEERGMANLYNTIYRIKQTLKNVPTSPQIQKLNEGYILTSNGDLSDLERMNNFIDNMKNNDKISVEEAEKIFFEYSAPMFGTKDYFWSVSQQKYFAEGYAAICRFLLKTYYSNNQFSKCENVIRTYAVMHTEDEDMMHEWLDILSQWVGYEINTHEYKEWFNCILLEKELPLLC